MDGTQLKTMFIVPGEFFKFFTVRGAAQIFEINSTVFCFFDFFEKLGLSASTEPMTAHGMIA